MISATLSLAAAAVSGGASAAEVSSSASAMGAAGATTTGPITGGTVGPVNRAGAAGPAANTGACGGTTAPAAQWPPSPPSLSPHASPPEPLPAGSARADATCIASSSTAAIRAEAAAPSTGSPAAAAAEGAGKTPFPCSLCRVPVKLAGAPQALEAADRDALADVQDQVEAANLLPRRERPSRRLYLEKKHSAHSRIRALAGMAGLTTEPFLLYKMIGLDALHVRLHPMLPVLLVFCSWVPRALMSGSIIVPGVGGY